MLGFVGGPDIQPWARCGGGSRCSPVAPSSPARAGSAIAWFATHWATEGLDVERYLLSHAARTTPAGLAQGPTALRDTGIHVDLGRVHQAAHITVRLSPPDRRELWFYRGGERLCELVAPASNEPVEVPAAAR
ncbi:MAG: hypothetical protein KC593_25015 [Myxococcales bacterium]|nr:hypothetical protein [Myxococcales bacterium]